MAIRKTSTYPLLNIKCLALCKAIESEKGREKNSADLAPGNSLGCVNVCVVCCVSAGLLVKRARPAPGNCPISEASITFFALVNSPAPPKAGGADIHIPG